MNLADIWGQSETAFRDTLSKASGTVEARGYVHKCAQYFIDAGCTDDEVENIERRMKKIVKEWTDVKFGSGNKTSDDIAIGKDIRQIKYFEPNQLYVFECIGQEASYLKDKLVKYETALLSRRKGGNKSYPKKFIDLRCVSVL
jgi:hypothetical protein